jgi:hypothetical protein
MARTIRTILRPQARSREIATSATAMLSERLQPGRGTATSRALSLKIRKKPVRKSLPGTMFTDPERSRLTMLRTWVLDNAVTEIEMKEQQFWNFAQLQPIAEKPWTTFMGRIISVPDMPVEAQKYLGIFDKRLPGVI